jgi:hypothetical protein
MGQDERFVSRVVGRALATGGKTTRTIDKELGRDG